MIIKVGLIPILWFCLSGLVIAIEDSTRSEEDVEKLLNSLNTAASQQEAQLLRKKIWETWFSDHSSRMAVDQFKSALRYFETNQLEQADKAFSKIISAYPSYMEAWNKRATIRYLKGDLQGSLADIQEVLLRQKRHFGALSGAGLIYVTLGDNQRALQLYLQLFEIDPWNEEVSITISVLKHKIYGKLL